MSGNSSVHLLSRKATPVSATANSGFVRLIVKDAEGRETDFYAVRTRAPARLEMSIHGRMHQNGSNINLPFYRVTFSSAADREAVGFGSAYFDDLCTVDSKVIEKFAKRT